MGFDHESKRLINLVREQENRSACCVGVRPDTAGERAAPFRLWRSGSTCATQTGEFWRAFGILVITTRGDRVSAITRFDNAVIGPFGFPRTLSD